MDTDLLGARVIPFPQRPRLGPMRRPADPRDAAATARSPAEAVGDLLVIAVVAVVVAVNTVMTLTAFGILAF